jgi:hypothetical protein
MLPLIMCTLFPIRSMLTVPPLTGSALWDKVRDRYLSSRYWWDLVRNKVPWNQWFRKQQEEACNERRVPLSERHRRTSFRQDAFRGIASVRDPFGLGERYPSFDRVELYHFGVIDALVIASCTVTLHPRSQLTRSSIFVNRQ